MRNTCRALLSLLLLFPALTFAGMTPLCQGHFVNPITDICWDCLFPITIGDADVVPGDMADTVNPVSPVQVCPSPVGYRIGITVGFWEPFAR